MNHLGQDIKYAVRGLYKSPAFTIIAVLSLALGIGANTSIFTLMDQVMLRALPVKDPQQLVTLRAPGSQFGMVFCGTQCFSYPLYQEIQQNNQVFEGVLSYFATSVSFAAGEVTERASAELVTGNYFQLLGLKAAAGRLLTPEDDRTPGGHPVAVFSHGFWQRRFGGNPKIINQTVRVNGQPYTVVGVAPAGFHSARIGQATELFVPITMKAQITPQWDGLKDRRVIWVEMMARLKPGVSRQQAQASLAPLFKAHLEEDLRLARPRNESFKKRYLSKQLEVHAGYHGYSDYHRQFEKPLWLLMAMVGLVLLIACANVANLLVARAAARQKEMSIRLALGAGRARIASQLVVESLMLSLLGGVGGLLVSAWTTSLLIQFLPFEGLTRTLSSEPDFRVLGFAMAVSVLSGLLFGLVPALQATRPDIIKTIREQASNLSGAMPQVRFRKVLVAAQVSLSLLLLIGAGLFARSLSNLRSLDPGFTTENIMTFSLDPALNGYKPERAHQFHEQLQRNLRTLPGVRNVSMATNPLLADNWSMSTIEVEGYKARDDEDMNPMFNGVLPGFFDTLGMRMLLGRDFTEADRVGTPKVAVVNEKFAKYFFKDGNPIGRRFKTPRSKEWTEIVGVVRDTKHLSLRDEISRFVFYPTAQTESVESVVYYVATTTDPVKVATAMRNEVRRLDAQLPVGDVKTFEKQADESLFLERVIAALSMCFGLLATILAAVGLYGVMAYTVARRTREIGIRMALGAERRQVMWMVMREVAVMAGIGIACALPLAYGLGRYIEAQLHGLKPNDIGVQAAATLTLTLVAILAGYVPGWRATRVDPMVALRYE
ncbi:MAG: ABC transporter permease [Bryobacteraceae bacterium]|nr:ABC transporter permease [Bryobacteraceae bacterium]